MRKGLANGGRLGYTGRDKKTGGLSRHKSPCFAVGVTYSGAIEIPVGGVTISLSGLAVAALVGIAMNAVLPGKDYQFGTNQQGDTSVNFGTRTK